MTTAAAAAAVLGPGRNTAAVALLEPMRGLTTTMMTSTTEDAPDAAPGAGVGADAAAW
jgi:hypothetical protein